VTAAGRHAFTDTPAWAVELLRTARVARLATVGASAATPAQPAGGTQPHVVPFCFALVGERVYWAVDAKPKRSRELRRVRNIEQNPRVAFVVDVWDEDWTRLAWVMVEGAAAVVTDDAERSAAIAALVAKYSQYAAMDLATAAGAVVAITPERVLAWHATA
jgi:PPOX class probable F420-dependent enzyme